MSNYTPLFYNQVILIHVLTPVLGWENSVKEIHRDAYLGQASNHYLHYWWPIFNWTIRGKPSWRLSKYEHILPIKPLENIVCKTSAKHSGTLDYSRLFVPAWAILQHIRTGDVQVNDSGIITWERFSHYWSSVRGIHRLPKDAIVKGQ